jgi:long-chain acyl-CoA synthetase
MARRSLLDYLDNFLKRGDECAYVQQRGYRTVRWTYRQVAETAYQFAHELSGRKIAKGDRVLIWGPNSAEWVAVFFGCALRGVVVVPMDDAAAPDFAVRASRQAEAKLWVCSREHAQSSPGPAIMLEDLASALEHYPRVSLPSSQVEAKDLLEIVFTSGTTAQPKGVVITHGNVLANIAPLESEIARYLKYERWVHPVRFLNLLPLSHVFGQFLGIFLPQLLGGTVIFQQTLKAADVVNNVRRERVSVLVAVPRLLQSLKDQIERDLEDDGRLKKFQQQFRASKGKHFLLRWWIFRRVHRQFGWKFWAFISGGAALDRETEEFWGRLGYAVVQGYGLTETTSLISLNHPFRLGKGSIGKVLPGREVKLAQDGEILVRGGGVTAGYWNGNEVRPAADEEGWYRTGDVGELDSDGNLYFKGRKKEVIVTPAGMNLYPEDLEAALRRQPEVKDCVVVALPQNGNAEPCAVVILRDGNNQIAQLEAVVSRANESLAEYQRMHKWFAWPEEDFPRTSTQKPKTAEVQQSVLSRLGQASSGRTAAGTLNELLGRISGRGAAELAPNLNLDADLGLNSLDRVELMGVLEERYQIDLSETRFAAVNTVGDLERLLHGTADARVRYHYPRWAQRWPIPWIRLLTHYVLLWPAVFLLGWPRVEGRENLRGVRGPVLVICNHVGDVDPGFILTALPARFRYRLAIATGGEALEILRTPPSTRGWLGKAYARVKWVLGVSLLNLFPLPREAGFRQSFSYVGESVDRGYSVLVFPEGRHTTDGQLLPFRAGIGLLANNLGIAIVPMRIDGLFERKQAGKKFAWPGQIRVKIGSPVTFSPNSDPQWIAAELQKKVAAL